MKYQLPKKEQAIKSVYRDGSPHKCVQSRNAMVNQVASALIYDVDVSFEKAKNNNIWETLQVRSVSNLLVSLNQPWEVEPLK